MVGNATLLLLLLRICSDGKWIAAMAYNVKYDTFCAKMHNEQSRSHRILCHNAKLYYCWINRLTVSMWNRSTWHTIGMARIYRVWWRTCWDRRANAGAKPSICVRLCMCVFCPSVSFHSNWYAISRAWYSLSFALISIFNECQQLLCDLNGCAQNESAIQCKWQMQRRIRTTTTTATKNARNKFIKRHSSMNWQGSRWMHVLKWMQQ